MTFTKTTRYCDKCKKEINFFDTYFEITTKRNSFGCLLTKTKNYDMCVDCFLKIKDELTPMEENK